MNVNQIKDYLNGIPNIKVEENKNLAPYTSYKIGGNASIWVEPGAEDSIQKVIEICSKHDIPLYVLGGGCNVLIADEGIKGVVLHIGENFSGWTFNGNEAEVKAGSVLFSFIRTCVEAGLGGMELMSGIPGNVGGALRMNAGAFGQEIQSTVTEVSGFTLSGEPFTLTNNQVGFGYRKAAELQGKIITKGRFKFKNEPPEILHNRMKDILEIRKKKQPFEFPSCGSVFKRPVGYYAGALIEEVGLKGKTIGGAQVSEKHAGFILNKGDAKAEDVLNLIRLIEKTVFEQFGMKLEREVKLFGWQGEE